jgi:hypothetical protein
MVPWHGMQQTGKGMHLYKMALRSGRDGIFAKRYHQPQFIVKKDHMRIELTKKTTYSVAAAPPGDTWSLPPEAVAAASCRRPRWRHVSRRDCRPAAVNWRGPCRRWMGWHACVEHASTLPGGSSLHGTEN